jgi:hypothetical protein
MARKDKQAPAEESTETTWTLAQLMAVKHLGPAIIGQRMFEAAQAITKKTNGGVFGPALLGELPESYKDQTPKAEA